MGLVKKLTIEGYEKMDLSGSPIGKIELQVNPETISLDYGITINGAASSSTSSRINNGSTSGAATPNPLLGNPTYDFPDLEISTIIDATGVLPAPTDIKLVEGIGDNQSAPSVAPFITQLKKVCYNYRDSSHGPPWLKVVWGKILPSNNLAQDQQDGIFKGRLSKLSIEYSLFGSDGNPVRASIKLTISSAIPPGALPKGQSPDLSHIIEIKYGDNLPALCKNIYGSPEFFLQIAKINNLPSIYAIEPGMKLLFPPLEKASR